MKSDNKQHIMDLLNKIKSSSQGRGVIYIDKKFSPEMWECLWEEMKKFSLETLDLTFIDFVDHPEFEQLWQIFCDWLAQSNLKFLSLERMNLNQLTLSQWKNLHQALDTIKLQSLDITCNHVYRYASKNDSENNEDEDEEINLTAFSCWQVICDIIKLPSLKHLRFREDWLERISTAGWSLLCETIEQSQLETLDISISTDKPLLEVHWLRFIQALSTRPLVSLKLSHYSDSEFIQPIIQSLCTMVKGSSLKSLSVSHFFGFLSLQPEEWEMFGDALKKRKIKEWDLGQIATTEENLSAFFQGIKLSEVDYLNLRGCYLNNMSSVAWEKFTDLIKGTGVTKLDLRGNYFDVNKNETWSYFCDFIVNSRIKSLILGACPSRDINRTQIEQFSNAIAKSNLRSLTLLVPGFRFPLPFYKRLLEGIKKSKICSLNLPHDDPSIEKAVARYETMKIVNFRAKHENTLFGLCGETLFGKYHAELTPSGIHYFDGDLEYEWDLQEGEIEFLRSTGLF